MLTTTSTVLLEGLADPENELVWKEFDGRYRPVIIAFACKLGLRPEDAADAAQETLTQFARDFRAGKYERDKGRLRSWLFAVTRNRVIDHHRAVSRRREHRGDSALRELAGESELEAVWDAEWRNAVLRHGMTELRAEKRIQPRTLEAFELFAFKGLAAADVAAQIEMTVNEVYVAKSRVLRRLQEVISKLEDIW